MVALLPGGDAGLDYANTAIRNHVTVLSLTATRE
jgi:hypothetical protein